MAALSVERPAAGKKTGYGTRLAAPRGAQTGVAGYPAGKDQAARANIFGGFDGATQELLDHGELKRRQQIESRGRGYLQPLLGRWRGFSATQRAAAGDFRVHVVRFHPAQHGGLDSAEAEIERVAFHLRQRESDRARIAERRQAIDYRTSGIAEAEKFGDFVERFAGGIVARLAQQAIGILRALRTGGCGRR